MKKNLTAEQVKEDLLSLGMIFSPHYSIIGVKATLIGGLNSLHENSLPLNVSHIL